MLSIAKRTAAGAALLLVMPVAVLISGWKWQPEPSGWGLHAFYWITETVTEPWGAITHLLLFGWFLWCLRFRLKAAIVLFAILGGVILLGQSVKSHVKKTVQEPRPYVVWLEQNNDLQVNEFYAQKRHARSAIVKEQVADMDTLPLYLRQHWQNETGFAFPSGHTMFVASWALLAVGLLWPRRRTLTILLLLGWAVAVMASRLVLGMHWPRDLIASTLISWLLVTLATWITRKLCGPLTPPPEEAGNIRERAE